MTKIDKKNFPCLGWFDAKSKSKGGKLEFNGDEDFRAFAKSSPLLNLLLMYTLSEPFKGDTYQQRLASGVLDPKRYAAQKRYYLADTIFDRIEDDLNIRNKLWPFVHELPSENGIIMAKGGIQYVYMILDPLRSQVFLTDRSLFTLPRFPPDTRFWMIMFMVKDFVCGFECGILNSSAGGPQRLEHHGYWHTETVPGQFIAFVGCTLLFLRFAEVETKVAGPSVPTGKRTVLNGEKYLNDTDVKVEFIDSRWFTTLVKSEGFGVKGHFRLVPTGSREVPLEQRPRKLTWIADFQKTGYTRTAKVLTQSADL